MNCHPARCLGVLAAVVSCAAVLAEPQAQPRLLELQDYYRLVDVSSPAVSPDGSAVAFVRTTTIEAQNRRHREIWIVPTDNRASPRRLTDPTHEASEPIWSPDGSRLAFRSTRRGDEEGVGAWRFLDLVNGGESFRVDGVQGRPVFSPDGDWIAFVKAVPPTGEARRRRDRSRYEVRSDDELAIEERFAGHAIEWMQYRWDGRGYLADPRDPVATPPRELFVVRAAGGMPHQLTDLGVAVTDLAWSPDSRRIAFSADLTERDEHTYERHDIWVADAGGNGVRRLTDGPEVDDAPVWADDATLVIRRAEGLDSLIARRAPHGAAVHLYRLEVGSPDEAVDPPRPLAPQWDFGFGRPVVRGADTIYFATDLDGEHHLFAVPAVGGEVRAVTSGRRWLSDFTLSDDGTLLAYVATLSTSPRHLRVMDLASGEETRLTRFNELLLSDVVLAEARNVEYTSPDGTRIEGWVILPPGYRAGLDSWPMILAMHGGPHGSYGERFSLEFQLWATAGYVVLYTNPRGSTGYGEAFKWATWGGGWGGLDTDDVMAGVEMALKRWDIDPARLGVTGYSYGGFLTNWIVANSDRFAAAVSGAGISNWLSDYATSDIPRTKESEFYGPPWVAESAELLWERSPVKHAAGATTPTLFLHGEADWRVPIEQAEQMYLALRKQRVPARFVRYPDTSHGGWAPWDDVHSMWETLEWWDRWFEPGS